VSATQDRASEVSETGRDGPQRTTTGLGGQ